MPDMKRPLTPKMVRDYIANHGALCPYCQSPEIESDQLGVDGESAWAPINCMICGREWQDGFFLGAIAVSDENGCHSDTVMPSCADSEGSRSR